MKSKRLGYSLSLRGMLVFAFSTFSCLGLGCANRNACMPGGNYGPYNGYPYAAQSGQQPIYPSQMVGSPINPGPIMPGQSGQPTTFAAPPPGYPTGAQYPQAMQYPQGTQYQGTQYPPSGYGPPPGAPGAPGGQPFVGR